MNIHNKKRLPIDIYDLIEKVDEQFMKNLELL